MNTVLPAPRLQLRWATPSKKDQDDFGFVQASNPEPGEHRRWICHYEIVLPLREHDIRREDADGQNVRSELAILINRSSRGTTETCPKDTPYRDGAHAKWDSGVLGGLPVYVIDPDGGAHPVDTEGSRRG